MSESNELPCFDAPAIGKRAVARLAGVDIPKHEDTKQPFCEAASAGAPPGLHLHAMAPSKLMDLNLSRTLRRHARRRNKAGETEQANPQANHLRHGHPTS